MAANPDSLDEPNLTPLLDLVLQLVMFFMLVVHFENEQKNEKVQLPKATAARGLTKNHGKVLFINLLPAEPPPDSQSDRRPANRSVITVFEGTAMREYATLEQLRNYMDNQFKRDQATTKKEDWDAGKGRSLVILRADRGCNFKQVYDVMTTARSVGYTEVQLRAEVKTTTGG
jgi:biopolymer transport protein ExbD